MSNRHEFSRSDRVRKALIREISEILAEEVDDPDLDNTIISVIDIDLSNDLRHAKVFLSVMGDAELQEKVMTFIEERAPKIRHHVGQRIRLRYTPELVFKIDDSLERGARVSELLNQIARGEVQ